MSLTGKAAWAAGMAFLVYLPFLAIPLISDDYIQLVLGRQYGPIAAWGDLAADVLYRSRTTSILLTFAVDQWLGADATAHRFLNLLLHAVNAVLVLLLGRWARIGWNVSVPAALFFAVHEGHQEAVVWSAAMPELLVFLFGVASFLCWREGYRGGSALAFGLALLSKESGVVVVPAIAAFWWWNESRDRRGLAWLAGMAAVAVGYTLAIFAAGESHLHLNDAGTFSLAAPFWRTVPISLGRLLWVWGAVALAILAWWPARRLFVGTSLGWMVLALLPYSFLTYMDRVPSRHTYLASLGLALLVGAAFVALRDLGGQRLRWAPAALAVVALLHNAGYLWTKKLRQYHERAEITERFLQEAQRQNRPIAVTCGAYGISVYRAAAIVRLGWEGERVQPAPASQDYASYCDPTAP